jgi:diadenosine tetraphosphate (Ap4A) HIT family hydrolase
MRIRQQFQQGLEKLIAAPELSVSRLVLVAINAIILHDAQLLSRVMQKAQLYLDAPQSDEEDQAVLRFIAQAPDPLNLIHYRQTPEGWQLQLNELRAHRPGRSASQPATTIHQSFDAAKFNFTHVPGEVFWTDQQSGTSISYAYNKYPFEPYHTLVIPDPPARREQFLRASDHDLVWKLCQTLGQSEPNIVLAYNALGAYASVNHLHFQMILDGSKLPLLRSRTSYPIPIEEYNDPIAGWTRLDHLQQTNQPFNVLYTPGHLLIITRHFQGSYSEPAWTSGFAWYELAGSFIVDGQASFEAIADSQIVNALHQVAA